MKLFLKEFKKIIFSFTYLLYVCVVFVMYFSQFAGDMNYISPPQKNLESYGYTAKEIPEILMPAAVQGLVDGYASGSFTAYPLGFYKEVRLTEKKKNALAEIITKLSGLTKEQLDALEYDDTDGYEPVPDGNGGFILVEKEQSLNKPEIKIPNDLTYEEFRELMRQADKIIGGGSNFSDDYIVGNFSLVPKTYEEALAEYNEVIYEEKITPAYARLFCDYSGIDLAIMPVFAAAAFADKDRKSRISEFIYSRKISSAKLVMTRFSALVCTMILPVILTVIHAEYTVCKMYDGFSLDVFAIPKYALLWLVPTMLTAISVGMLFTELFSPLAAVFVQGVWWFADIFASSGSLHGNIKSFTLVPRHNSLYYSDAFFSRIKIFTFNRVFFTLLSAVLVIFTIFVYEAKREGHLNGLKNFTHNKNKSEK